MKTKKKKEILSDVRKRVLWGESLLNFPRMSVERGSKLRIDLTSEVISFWQICAVSVATKTCYIFE